MVFHNAVVRRKLEYVHVAWNSILLTESRQLEMVQENLQPHIITDFYWHFL
jgi:hypothetical protein